MNTVNINDDEITNVANEDGPVEKVSYVIK